MSSSFRFELRHTDAYCAARRGTFHTPHGPVELPAFMPVGTQAAIKALTTDQVRSTGAQMILGNTYHLALRPGEEVIRELGGLHPFMSRTAARYPVLVASSHVTPPDRPLAILDQPLSPLTQRKFGDLWLPWQT